jgi:hypothetical protein
MLGRLLNSLLQDRPQRRGRSGRASRRRSCDRPSGTRDWDLGR